jgi:hypothetical protein
LNCLSLIVLLYCVFLLVYFFLETVLGRPSKICYFLVFFQLKQYYFFSLISYPESVKNLFFYGGLRPPGPPIRGLGGPWTPAFQYLDNFSVAPMFRLEGSFLLEWNIVLCMHDILAENGHHKPVTSSNTCSHAHFFL